MEIREGHIYMVPEEIAEELRVSKMTVYRLIQNGELSGVRVGRNWRVRVEAFEDYVNENTT